MERRYKGCASMGVDFIFGNWAEHTRFSKMSAKRKRNTDTFFPAEIQEATGVLRRDGKAGSSPFQYRRDN